MRDWLSEKVLDAPSGGLATKEGDDSSFAVVPRADALDLYFGRKRVLATSIAPQTGRALLGFLLRWWICYEWCGLRRRLVDWARGHRLRREYEAASTDLSRGSGRG